MLTKIISFNVIIIIEYNKSNEFNLKKVYNNLLFNLFMKNIDKILNLTPLNIDDLDYETTLRRLGWTDTFTTELR